MGFFGGLIGKTAGRAIGGLVGQKKLGGALGNFAGSEIVPYKTGGLVKKTGLAYLHKNETVLPAHIKPTKAQKAGIAAAKRRAKK